MRVNIGLPWKGAAIFSAMIVSLSELEAQSIVVHTSELPEPLINRVVFDARANDRTQLSYIATRDRSGSVRISVARQKSKKVYMLLSKEYPQIDLSTMRVYYDQINKEPHVTFRFGDDRDCSIEPDGRDSIRVVFIDTVVQTFVLRAAGCS